MQRLILTVMLMVMLAPVTGCGGQWRLPFSKQTPASEAPPAIEGVPAVEGFAAYPHDAPLGADLDIVTVTRRGQVTFTNRTAHNYSNARVWLNQQYVGTVPQILIGQSVTLPLTQFTNQHGEHFPIAGFLTPEKGFPLLAAEIFDPATGHRHRLLARP